MHDMLTAAFLALLYILIKTLPIMAGAWAAVAIIDALLG